MMDYFCWANLSQLCCAKEKGVLSFVCTFQLSNVVIIQMFGIF